MTKYIIKGDNDGVPCYYCGSNFFTHIIDEAELYNSPQEADTALYLIDKIRGRGRGLYVAPIDYDAEDIVTTEPNEMEQLIKQYIKDHLVVKVETKSSGSECSYNSGTYVQLVLDDKIISEAEIQDLGKDY